MILSQANDWQELDRLIDGACDWTLLADEWTKLGQWLIEYPEARVHYLACMDIHGTLAWQMMPDARLSPAELQQYTQAEIDLLSIEDGRLSDASLPVSPSLGFLGSAFHGTVGYFSQEVPFACLIATVLCGLGLLIGSLITVSRDVEIARESVPPVAEPPAFEKIEYVGRITGTVDCRWAEGLGFRVQESWAANLKSEIRNQRSLVALGDTFALASGLMEITYDTGAKVILQGPCTYEAESAAGGFLSLGKLTARVNSVKPQAANPKSQIPNPKSLSSLWNSN